jgi:hypothetical protein
MMNKDAAYGIKDVSSSYIVQGSGNVNVTHITVVNIYGDISAEGQARIHEMLANAGVDGGNAQFAANKQGGQIE